MNAPKPLRQDGARIVDANGDLVTLISCGDKTTRAILRAVNTEQTLRDMLKSAADKLQDLADAGYNDGLAMEIYKELGIE